MHQALDLRVGAALPLIAHLVPDDDDTRTARDRSADAVGRVIEAAQTEGGLRSDVAFGDIGMLLVRLSRPVRGPFSPETDQELAHRHLALLLDGLQAHRTPLPVPALSLQNLRGQTTPRNHDDDHGT
jgi:hypothetical protein